VSAAPTVQLATLQEHPAVRAWQAASGGRRDFVAAVEPLKLTRKSSVFRLTTDRGWSLIAKLTDADTVRREQVIYEMLSRLPVSSLDVYGCSGATDRRAWLFLEDAGNPEPAPPSVVGEWLGHVHASGMSLEARSLPARDPQWFAQQLAACRGIVQGNDSPESAGTLQPTSAVLDRLAAHWPAIARRMDDLPSTLVHCDLQPKNLTLQAGRLLVFDWEMGGWGCPAIDIYRGSSFGDSDLFLEAYRKSSAWPLPDVEAVLTLGRILWKLQCLAWSSSSLPYATTHAAALEEVLHATRGLSEALEEYR
jgi:hypothetical protein